MTEPAEQRPTLAPGTRLGEFVIERRLGAGGMGEVYAARHHEIAEKRAAVKILLPQHATNAEVRMRFVREARASASLRHPNAVNVFGAGIEGTTPYIVMEFLEGEDLDARIERAPMSVTDAVDVLIPVASALARAHDLGIVHRDLKPANVFLALDGDGEISPKVLDFGISKLGDRGEVFKLTGTNVILGTLLYMSPEQIARPRDVTHAADQFSFGAMAYQCLSRDVPFPGETVLAVIRAIAESEPRPLRELVPNLPPALEAVVRRMLSKDPAHRFASMREVGIALLPWASPHVRSQYERRFSTAKPEPTGEASETSPPIVPASPAATNAARRPISTLSSMVGERLVPRESRSFWVGGVGALVVAAGLGTWWFVGSSATTEEVRPAARAQPSATPAEPAALAPSEVEARPPAVDVPASEPSPTHSMQLAPPEAELFVDDVRVTPSSFSLSEGPHRVEVRAPGFVTQTFELGSSVDLPERVELEAVRRSSPRVDMRRNPRPRPEPTAVPAPEFRSPALDEPYEIN